jgi:potassium-transporting ATPase ATP-binding subunit
MKRKSAVASLRPLELLRKIVLKFRFREQLRNPVMFIVYLGTIAVTFLQLVTIARGGGVPALNWHLVVWLWFTLAFANAAEALAEIQGKARADSLRGMRKGVKARRIREDDSSETVDAANLKKGDLVRCSAGELIPVDGEVVEGIASVNEAAVTGESAPVIRESGGDRSAVIGGTTVVSDTILIRVSEDPGRGFIDRMAGMVEQATRKPTPGEVALSILLACLSAIFVAVVATLYPLASFVAGQNGQAADISLAYLLSLLACLLPTTISSLLSAIGISGITRLMKRNVLALSGRAVEAAGDIDVLLVDKTGTITLGDRKATELIPAREVSLERLVEACAFACQGDDTPEGRSILSLLESRYRKKPERSEVSGMRIIPFSASTQMSGLDAVDAEGRAIFFWRKGSGQAIRAWAKEKVINFPDEVEESCSRIGHEGGTPLVVADGEEVLGVVHLKDIVKPGIRERFERLHRLGIRTVMITGDNPLTAAAIAA